MRVVGTLLLAIALQGCSMFSAFLPDEHSRITTGPDGLRTFNFVLEMQGTPVACGAFGLVDPVHGVLRGGPGEREPVWLETDDGRKMSVVWPAGFSVKFEPTATLYSDKGTRIAGTGEEVELSQTRWETASGTFEDPYVADGLVFNGCYPFIK